MGVFRGSLLVCAVLLAGCSLILDPDDLGRDEASLARYRFEDLSEGVVIDDLGDHDGLARLRNGLSAPPVQSGPVELGDGVAYSASQDAWLVIPDSQAWDLNQGSVDLWVYLPEQPLPTATAILSRDEYDSSGAGRFGLFYGAQGRLGARINNAAGQESGACSGDVPVNRWFHVGVNFGPQGTELWIDGELSAAEDVLTLEGGNEIDCSEHLPMGIAGNDFPWIIGAQEVASEEPGSDAYRWFQGGIDHLRISREPRNFAVDRFWK